MAVVALTESQHVRRHSEKDFCLAGDGKQKRYCGQTGSINYVQQR